MRRGLLNNRFLAVKRSSSLFSPLFQTQSFFANNRTITNVREMKGSYECFKEKKEFSPLHGVVMSFTGTLEYLYDCDKITPSFSKTSALVALLFNKLGSQFRASELKSSPAYSLSPSLIARILHLSIDKSQQAHEELLAAWKKQHKESTGHNLSMSKATALLDLIAQSKKETEENKYPPHTTENILLGFLYHKAKNQSDIASYLQALGSLNPSLYKDFSKLKIENFDLNEIKKTTNNLIKNASLDVNTIEKNYEELTATLILSSIKLSQVIQGNYGFENQQKVPNCAEAAFHNLINILVYNNINCQFDLDQLPKTLKLSEKLQDFYRIQDFKAEKVNAPEIGQAFMNMVSGVANIKYCQKNYELDPGNTHENLILLLNELFGSSATTLDELSSQFSDDRRKIIFISNKDNIFIDIVVPNVSTEHLVFNFNPNHCDLRADRFHNVVDKKTEKYKNIAKFAYQTRHLPILTMLNKVVNLRDDIGLNNYLSLCKDQTLSSFIRPKTLDEKEELLNHLIQAYQSDKQVLRHILHLVLNTSSHSIVSKSLLFLINNGLVKTHPIVQDYSAEHLADYFWLKYIFSANYSVKESIIISEVSEFSDILIKKGKFNSILMDQMVRFFCPNSVSPLLITLLKAFLNKGANPNATDEFGNTPLHHYDGQYAEHLLKAGANPNVKNRSGETPLHRTLSMPGMEFMLAAGADPNAVDQHGNTPLHYNAYAYNKAYILIQAGANPNVVNKDGRTPIDNAKCEGVKDMMVKAMSLSGPRAF